MSEITEVRRKAFDRWYADNRGVIGCGPYKKEFEVWNAALDSVCVELPDEIKPPSNAMGNIVISGYNAVLNECRSAIERVGLKVKS